MSEQTVRRDLEGELVRRRQGTQTSYVKRLPLDVAWHVDNPQDLLLLDALVKRIEQDLQGNTLSIHYKEAIQPLGMAQLRGMLNPSGPLAVWRFARFMSDLCTWLSACHHAGIPQLLIHPGRIGLLEREFVLFPTLARVLPPLSNWLFESDGRWLRFTAPEVLRTRGSVRELLQHGDVYSLGQTVQLLAVSASEADSLIDPFEAADSFVETPDRADQPPWPPGLEVLHSLVNRMTALLPQDRPSLAEVTREIHFLTLDLDPKKQVTEAIADKRLADARALLADLQNSQVHPVFDFPAVEFYMLHAKVAQAESPPDYAGAIDKLDKAQRHEPQNAFIALQTARTYKQFKTHSQHLLLADNAFAKAALLSGWHADVIDEWLSVLEQLPPEKLIDRTNLIPQEKRTAPLITQRAAAFLKRDRSADAWNETASFFERFEFNEQVFGIAQTAAEAFSPLELIAWRYSRPGADRLDALLAIVWARNGAADQAALYFARALGSPARNKE